MFSYEDRIVRCLEKALKEPEIWIKSPVDCIEISSSAHFRRIARGADVIHRLAAIDAIVPPSLRLNLDKQIFADKQPSHIAMAESFLEDLRMSDRNIQIVELKEGYSVDDLALALRSFCLLGEDERPFASLDEEMAAHEENGFYVPTREELLDTTGGFFVHILRGRD